MIIFEWSLGFEWLSNEQYNSKFPSCTLFSYPLYAKVNEFITNVPAFHEPILEIAAEQ